MSSATVPREASPTALPPCAPDVVRARALDHLTLAVELDDGRSGVLDLGWLLDYPAFARLRQPTYLARVGVAWGALTWPEGEDISPESVSARLVERAEVW